MGRRRSLKKTRRSIVKELDKLGFDGTAMFKEAEAMGLAVFVDTFPTTIIINNNVTEKQVRAYPSKSGWYVSGTCDRAIVEFVEKYLK